MAASIGSISKSYVSAFTAVDTRELDPKVTDITNEARFINTLFRAGRALPVTQWFYRTWVNEQLFKQGDTTGATVTGSGTASVTTAFTVATSGMVRKNDLVQFATSQKIAHVQNVTTASSIDTVVLKSVDGTNITHTAGEKIIIFGRAVGEKSTYGSNLRFGNTSYINKVQIVDEVSDITDVQNAATVEWSYNGSNKYIVKDHLEKKLRLERMLDAIFIKSEMSATSHEDSSPSLTDPVNSGSVQTTRGVDKYINSYGILDQVASLGTWAITDLDDAQDQLIAARSPEKYTVLAGDAVLRKIFTYLKGLGSSGVVSAFLNVDGKDLDYTVQKLDHGKFSYQFVSMNVLDDPDLFGGSIEQKSAYFLPMDLKVKAHESAMSASGGSRPAIQTRYIKSQTKFGNEMVSEVHSGALSPVNPNGDDMIWKTRWITAQGLECLGVQHFLRHRVLS